MDADSQNEAGLSLEHSQLIFQKVQGPLIHALQGAASACLRLPLSTDFHFYSNFKEFKESSVHLRSRITALLASFGEQDGLEDDEDALSWLTNLQDDLLERVQLSLEESEKKPSSKPLLDVSVGRGVSSKPRGPSSSLPRFNPSCVRPQASFSPPVNNANEPFQPPLWTPLDSKLSISGASSGAESSQGGPGSGFEHPLKELLASLQYQEWQLTAQVPREAESADNTPFTLVEQPEQLYELAAALAEAKEIAVDLENHNYRSFQGFVCLMQISTRSADYVVDTLGLRSLIGPVLGPFFANPEVVKVMHGADRDIVWLQRDFGIFVANLFDTGQASRVLHMAGFGLAHLLHHFCDVNADKQYQLADWRIRPLPAEMLKYAREDTHYLLYIYDCLRERLVAAAKEDNAEQETAPPLLQVLERSRLLCLQKYEKELLSPRAHLRLAEAFNRHLHPLQLAVLKDLYEWRDKTARSLDESPSYVMPHHLLLRIAEKMPLDVKRLNRELREVSPIARKNAAIIVSIILQAREQSVKPALPGVTLDSNDSVAGKADGCYREGEALEAGLKEERGMQGAGTGGPGQAGPGSAVSPDVGPAEIGSMSIHDVPVLQEGVDSKVLEATADPRGTGGGRRIGAGEESSLTVQPAVIRAIQQDSSETAGGDLPRPLPVEGVTGGGKQGEQREAGDDVPAVSEAENGLSGVPNSRRRVKATRVTAVRVAHQQGVLATILGTPATRPQVATGALQRLQATFSMPFGAASAGPKEDEHGAEAAHTKSEDAALPAPETSGQNRDTLPGQEEEDQAVPALQADVLLFEVEDEERGGETDLAMEKLQGSSQVSGMGTWGASELPLPLSQAYKVLGKRKSRPVKKKGTGQDGGHPTSGESLSDNPERAQTEPQFMAQGANSSVPGEVQPLTAGITFDYATARAEMEMSAKQLDADMAARKPAGKKKILGRGGGTKSAVPAGGSSWHFDPLREAEGAEETPAIKPGKRSQVYPRSGNRSTTFQP